MSLTFTKKTIFTVSLDYEDVVRSAPFSQKVQELIAPFVTNNKTDNQVEILIGITEAKFIRNWVDLTSAQDWVDITSTQLNDVFMISGTYEILDYTALVSVN